MQSSSSNRLSNRYIEPSPNPAMNREGEPGSDEIEVTGDSDCVTISCEIILDTFDSSKTADINTPTSRIRDARPKIV